MATLLLQQVALLVEVILTIDTTITTGKALNFTEFPQNNQTCYEHFKMQKRRHTFTVDGKEQTCLKY